MSIKKEFQRLQELLGQVDDPKKFNLEAVLAEAVVFFEELRREYPAAPKEERDEMMRMMGEIHERLQTISKEITQATGMSDEELQAFSENPSNFSPEDWQVIQKTKKELYQSARKFSDSLSEEREGVAQSPEDQEVKKKRPQVKSKGRRTKRARWTKS